MSAECRFESYSRSSVAERRPGQQVQRPHLRSDKALDVAAKMWLAWRAPIDCDACVLAPSLEGPAAKVGAVVHVQRFRQASDGPRFDDLPLPQPCGFVEYRMQQAEAGR